MFKNVRLILIFEVVLIINSAHGDNVISTNKIDQNKTKIEREDNETILGKLGISYENQKIIIDLNKSRHFFSQMTKTIEIKAKKLKNEIEKTDIFMDINKSISQ